MTLLKSPCTVYVPTEFRKMDSLLVVTLEVFASNNPYYLYMYVLAIILLLII